MFLGQFQANFIPMVSFVMGVGSILACYFISQYYHHEKPFPDTWISATADHYPEFIVFRVGTIAGAVLMALSHMICYFWVLTLGYENVFDIGRYRPQIGAIMGVGGALFLMGNTSTLDTGKHNTNWHVFCAVNAFLWSILACWYHSYISFILYTKTGSVGMRSTAVKIILSVLILIQIILDSTAQTWISVENKPSRLSNALEYTIAFSVFGFFLIMAFDLRGFKMMHRSKPWSSIPNLKP